MKDTEPPNYISVDAGATFDILETPGTPGGGVSIIVIFVLVQTATLKLSSA